MKTSVNKKPSRVRFIEINRVYVLAHFFSRTHPYEIVNALNCISCTLYREPHFNEFMPFVSELLRI